MPERTPPKLSSLPYSIDAIVPGASFNDVSSQFEDQLDPVNLSSGALLGNTTLQDGHIKSSNYDGTDGTGGTVGWYLGPENVDLPTVEVTELHIPDQVTANSFHVDSQGNAWWGATTLGSALASILRTGAATFTNIAITGGSITATPISGIPNSTATDISLLDYTHTMTFSASDNNTVAWTSGTITLSNGRTFSISSGNTGNMAAFTWIYLDTGTSSTVLQTTTTAATAMGANKIILATAQNNSDASANALYFVPKGTTGAALTASSIKTSSLSAIAANLGTITAGTVTGATIQTASSGTRFRMTSNAFEALNSLGDYVFKVWLTDTEIGDVVMGSDGSGTYAFWDNSAGTFQVFADNIPQLSQGTFGGDGSDGALSISSGTTTLSAASASTLVKNYTSISITSTGKLAFSNPATGGTIITLKSQGNVTITSSGSPTIDLRGIGAAAATDPNGLVLATNSPKGNNTSDPDVVTTGGARYDMYNFYTTSTENLSRRYVALVPGAGGGQGAGGLEGAGGRGGGALLIECNGALNFGASATINSSGNNGSNASGAGGGGGGGGSAGTVVILYNTLTANSGTITASGGSGGNATSPDGDTGGGAGAGSLYGAGGDGGASTGTGPGAGGGNGAGGGGGAGTTTGGAGGGSMGGLVAKNVYFA